MLDIAILIITGLFCLIVITFAAIVSLALHGDPNEYDKINKNDVTDKNKDE